MKRLFVSFVALVLSVSVKGQVVMDFSMFEKNRNVEVKFELKDSQSEEPIPWASAYLVPVGDTVITSFALSDDKGKVNLKDVPVGKYTLNVELIGYKPYKKVHDCTSWDVNLGVIKMEENPEMIDAASISAVGNPIEVLQDTIIYNASSFKVGENDMLEELLKKMPGMEVGDDGTVKVNGEAVDKITVGGKTFFFNDPSAALKNLPAKIVDKIKVVDKTKDAAAFTGVATQDDKEKVMDIELKQEYTKGWFGNAKLGGGASVNPDKKSDLVEDGKFLYNGSALVTGYTEKDQVVILGNGHNVMDAGTGMVMYTYVDRTEVSDDYSKIRGLTTSAQGGVNYNTDRIKGVETNASAMYKNNTKDSKKVSSRISFQPSGEELYTDTKYTGYGVENGVNASLEFKNKEKKKYSFEFRPTFNYARNRVTVSNQSQTYTSGASLNKSTSDVQAHNTKTGTGGWADFGVRDLGKKNRSLTISLDYDISNQNGDKTERTQVEYTSSTNVKNIDYDIKREYYHAGGSVSYVEPISKRWLFRGNLSSSISANNNSEMAYSAGVLDNYYSSANNSRYLKEAASLLFQYNNDTTNVQFGLKGDMVQNVINTRSMGVETITGKGEWLYNWSPFLSYRYRKGESNLYLYYSGYTQTVSGDKVIPTLDISNPIQIQAGNIYLKPTFYNNFSATYRVSNKKSFSYFYINVYGNLVSNPIVTASWFDGEGVRYGIPVNSQKLGTTVSSNMSFNKSFGKDKKYSMSLDGYASYTANTSYQSAGEMEGLDLDNFDYYKFMESFWGDESGDLFYSGKSGFQESRTNTLSWSASTYFKYNADKLNISLRAGTRNRISRYSLDPNANLNTWDHSFSGDVTYKPGKGWELKNYLGYTFYRGYANGYGDPSFNWNLSVGKSIKAVTISLSVKDILNQTKSLNRYTSDEYTEDTYSNVLGRYFLFTVSFNFGKMNAKKNSRVQNAMWNMMF